MSDRQDLYFMSNLSHQLRTPLNGIVGYTQLLSQTKMDRTQQQYTGTIVKCCLQLVELVNNVLDLSKLSSGKAKIDNECFTFKEVSDEVSSAVGCQIAEKKQKLLYVKGEELPDYIVADKQKIIQVLINLVSNANKFTKSEGRIIVSVIPLRNNFLEFTVEDNGVGIPKNQHKNLFTPFFQVEENQGKNEGNSSGLGLAICKKLVELMGGTISLQSEKDQGSIFTFTIKYEPYENFTKQVEENSYSLKGKYILVADEDPDSRMNIGEILFDCGVVPVLCSKSKEALSYVSKKRFPFSLALIDVCSIGTNLAKEIDIPTIAMSSLDETFDHSNFDKVIMKPINRIKLLDTMTKMIGKSEVSQFELNPVEVSNIPEKKVIKILIAEDVSYNSEMLRNMLTGLGYKNVDSVSNGEEAIEKIDSAKVPYDVLLLDLKMPKIDGIGVAEHIRKKGYAYPKVAVLTASVLETDREKCRANGVKYFLLKPVNLSHLKTIIGRLIYGTERR